MLNASFVAVVWASSCPVKTGHIIEMQFSMQEKIII